MKFRLEGGLLDEGKGETLIETEYLRFPVLGCIKNLTNFKELVYQKDRVEDEVIIYKASGGIK